MQFHVFFVAALTFILSSLPLSQASSQTGPKFTTTAPTDEQQDRCAQAPSGSRIAECHLIYSIAALQLPTRPESGRPKQAMGLFKPEGDGPFPVLVLLPTCGAVSPNLPWWAERALARGYAALIVDSWTQRGYPNGTCELPRGTVTFNLVYLRARDAYDALDHVATMPFIDAKRAFAIGFSHGARGIYLLGSRQVAAMYSPHGLRFAATASLYGECFSRKQQAYTADVIWPDIDTPLLSLLGDSDEDGDPRECVPRFEKIKANGAPIDWRVFQNAGHSFDSPQFERPVRRPYDGAKSGFALYWYNAEALRESERMVFDLFQRVAASVGK